MDMATLDAAAKGFIVGSYLLLKLEGVKNVTNQRSKIL